MLLGLGQIPWPQRRQVLSLSSAHLVFLLILLCPLGRMSACLLALPPQRRWLSTVSLPSLEFDLPRGVLASLLLIGYPKSLGDAVFPQVPQALTPDLSWLSPSL